MKYAFRAGTLLAALFSLALISSCGKGNKCGQTSPIVIDHNGPLSEGWTLNLEVNHSSPEYVYKWSGPNGWKWEGSGGASNKISIPGITMADSGEYKVQLVNEGCIEYEGMVDIQVIEPPDAPCTLPANTSTSTVAGLGAYTFTSYNFFVDFGHYWIIAAEGGNEMRLSFAGNNPPIPGAYKVHGYYGGVPGKVGLHISAGGNEIIANSDETVYVTKVNDKLEVAFCSVKFHNPMGLELGNISARIVQP